MKRFSLIIMMMFPLAVFCQEGEQMVVETTYEAPGIYRMFVGNRVAVVVFDGPDGLLVVDAAYEQTTGQLMEAISGVSQEPIRYLVNTHIHGDHTGGNAVLGRDADIIAHHSVKEYLSKERRQGERVIPAFAPDALPNITFSDRMSLDFNGQTLQLIHLPEGHTGGDIIVFFPKSNLLVMGDLLFAGYFPYVDVDNGGNPIGFINNVEWVINNFPRDVKLIGGHGPVYDMQQLREYHSVLSKTLEVVQQAKSKGISPEKMKADRILKQWEDYGAFFITEDRWIDTLYQGL